MVAVGLVLLFLLTQATTNRELYERNYARLFAVNVVVAALLIAVGIVWWTMPRKHKPGPKPGNSANGDDAPRG
mgnify:CR=1 FL=1